MNQDAINEQARRMAEESDLRSVVKLAQQGAGEMSSNKIPHWPVLDCLGRRIEYLCQPPASVEPGFEARAFRDGSWSPWHVISATTYENRKIWPREGYEIRRQHAKDQPK